MLSEAVSTAILTFWFGDPSQDTISYRDRRKLWFGKSAAVDFEVKQRFEQVYRRTCADIASAPSAGDWMEDNSKDTAPAASLALTLLLDQFPRHMFRGTPAAFASDGYANAAAKGAIAHGFDQALPPLRRMFLYFPLEHSESLADQQQSVDLFQALGNQAPELQDAYGYAVRHRQVIERFGRFPHRNPILGRRSTPAEVMFLRQPGSSF